MACNVQCGLQKERLQERWADHLGCRHFNTRTLSVFCSGYQNNFTATYNVVSTSLYCCVTPLTDLPCFNLVFSSRDLCTCCLQCSDLIESNPHLWTSPHHLLNPPSSCSSHYDSEPPLVSWSVPCLAGLGCTHVPGEAKRVLRNVVLMAYSHWS